MFSVPDPVEVDLDPQATQPQVDLLIRAAELIRDEFDPKSWTCFERMVIGEDPAADVAGDLEMSVAAVRQAKYRVLRHLRTFCHEFL